MFTADLLAGQTAIITGGGTGLGLAMAQRFASLGANVVLASRDQAHLDAGAAAIAAAVPGRIYDPFFSTKGLGRGLALAVAAGIARAHGGGIGVETEVGRGSTFRLFVPAVVAGAAAN